MFCVLESALTMRDAAFRIPFFAPPPEKEVKDAPKPLLVSLPGSTTVPAESSSTSELTEAGPSTLPTAVSEEASETGDAFYETSDTFQSVRGEKRVKGVDQPIRKIVVTNKFLPDDQRRYEDEQDDEDDEEKGEPAEADDSEEEGVFEQVEAQSEEESEEEEELGWDDVVAAGPSRSNAKGKGRAVGVVGPTGAVLGAGSDAEGDIAAGASRCLALSFSSRTTLKPDHLTSLLSFCFYYLRSRQIPETYPRSCRSGR
jgi:hypothetical protein